MKKTDLNILIAKIKASKDAESDLKTIMDNMTASQKTSLEKNANIKAVFDKRK